MNQAAMDKHSVNCLLCGEIVDERECVKYHDGGEVCETCMENPEECEGLATCIMCGSAFLIGQDGNELGFCESCQNEEDFPYDLDAYYKDHDAGKVGFKGFDTMDRGLLEAYRK